MRPKDAGDILRELEEIRTRLGGLEERILARRPTAEKREISQPRIPPTPTARQARTGGTDLDRWHAFWIALVLIVGFLGLIGLPAIRADVQSAKELAAIFSAWIAAIVGFYFLQGQAREAVKYAAGEAGLERARSAIETMVSAMDRYRERNAELEEAVDKLGETLLESLSE